MKLLHKLSWAALFLAAAFCSSGAARGAEPAATGEELSILKVVPADALVVGIVHHLDAANAKIGRLTATIGVPAPDLLEQFKSSNGIQEGLDEKGPAGGVLLPVEGGEGSVDQWLMYLPVTDYQKFIAQFHPADTTGPITEIHSANGGKGSLVCRKGTFAVIVDGVGNGDRKLLERALADSTGIEAKLEPLSGWIGEHDISLVATSRGVKLGVAAMRKSFQAMKTTMAANPQTKSAAGMFESFDSFLEQASREITLAAAGAHIEDDGSLHIDGRAVWTPDGQFAATAKKIPLPSGIPMSGLPAGPFLMAFDGEMPQALSQSLMNFSADILKSAGNGPGGKELTPEQTKKIKEMLERSTEGGMHSMAMVMGTPKPGESMYGGTVAIVRVDDARKYLDRYQKSLTEANELMKSLDLPFQQQIEVKPVTVEGLSALEMTMDVSKSMGAAGNPAMKKMMESMIGPGGKLKVYLAAADERTVVMAYVSPENLTRAIAAGKNPQTSLSADPNVTVTAGMLWRDALWIGYLSPKGMMDFSMGMAMQMMPPGAMPQLPPFPDSPPIGIAVAVSPGSLNAQIVLPVDTLKASVGYFMGMGRMFMPRPQPQPRRPGS